MRCGMTEHQLYELIAQYLQVQYPGVIYRFDLAADLKLTAGQARKHKILHPRRGYPDLFIAEPANGMHGLYIEIKVEGTRLKKRNGEWASPHIDEQAKVLSMLLDRGYEVRFACGFDSVKEVIDEYLKERRQTDLDNPF